MLELKRGDILSQDAEALVNTVNCVGIMGRGIALQFRRAFPQNYEAYRQACQRDEVQPGRMFVYDLNRLQNPRLIINFPTKRHWRGRSRIQDIESGLRDLVKVVQDRRIDSIAIPPLGCGLGGLSWGDVRPLIERAFSAVPSIQVYLYEPAGPPAPEPLAGKSNTTTPGMTQGRAALLALMGRYLNALMDVSVSLLEAHKLMYFLQDAGEPLRLHFTKGHYGPYAKNLRHVFNLLEAHYIQGFGDGADSPTKELFLIGDAADQGENYLSEHPETKQRFERVSELISGFETPFGMELLATVHWVAAHEGASTLEEVTQAVYSWGKRKQMFDPDQIAITWGVLRDLGWLETEA